MTDENIPKYLLFAKEKKRIDGRPPSCLLWKQLSLEMLGRSKGVIFSRIDGLIYTALV